MNQLSTEIKNQVIVFHDKSHKFITQAQASLIFQASGTNAKSITTPALGMITFSAIAKVMSIDDFYTEYPQHREEQPRDLFKEMYSNQQIRQPSTRAGELIKKGFIDYKISRNKTYEQALKEFNEFKICL